MKLAEALLRRKQLADKVKVIGQFKAVPGLFDTKVKRVAVSEGYEDLQAQVPKLALAEVTAEFDHYSKQLRLIDAAIQQANWTVELPEVGNDLMSDWTPEMGQKYLTDKPSKAK